MKKQKIVKIATTSVVVATVSVMGVVAITGDIKVLKKEVQLVEQSKANLEKEYKALQSSYDKLKNEYQNVYSAYKQSRDIITKELYANPYNITEPSGAEDVHMYKALEGTDLYSLAPVFIEAEDKYGINSIMLASLVATESAWGQSNRAINDNNMTGYAVYNDSSRGVIFDTKEECILRTARLLSEDYIPSDSKHNTGANIWRINKVYSADENWADTISNISETLVTRGEF